MARSIHEQLTVHRPDFVPEGQEDLYPHLGGVYHDFIPEGKKALDMYGPTDDATPKPPDAPTPIRK